MTIQAPPPPPLFALFENRIPGDDSLLRQANLRFAQAGLGAEVYAETSDELEWLLGFVPAQRVPPMVHLSRSLDLLREDGRQLVVEFGTRFAGRVLSRYTHPSRRLQ